MFEIIKNSYNFLNYLNEIFRITIFIKQETKEIQSLLISVYACCEEYIQSLGMSDQNRFLSKYLTSIVLSVLLC